jgi:hypothetical protein
VSPKLSLPPVRTSRPGVSHPRIAVLTGACDDRAATSLFESLS